MFYSLLKYPIFGNLEIYTTIHYIAIQKFYATIYYIAVHSLQSTSTEIFRDACALTLSCMSSCLFEGIVPFTDSQGDEPYVQSKSIPIFLLP